MPRAALAGPRGRPIRRGRRNRAARILGRRVDDHLDEDAQHGGRRSQQPLVGLGDGERAGIGAAKHREAAGGLLVRPLGHRAHLFSCSWPSAPGV